MTRLKKIKNSEPAKIPSQLFKRSTTRAIRKLESNIPYYFQAYSDMYRECLHVLDDYFMLYYIFEHKYYENQLHDEKSILHICDNMVWNTTNMMLLQMESFANIHKMFVQTYASIIKSVDQNMHRVLNYYML